MPLNWAFDLFKWIFDRREKGLNELSNKTREKIYRFCNTVTKILSNVQVESDKM